MDSTLTLTYSVPAREPLDLLLIEQQEWEKNVGVVTTGEMLRYISAYIYSQMYSSRTNCGFAGDALTCTIHVYPRVPGLAYRLRTSWGNLGPRRGGLTTITEVVDFSLSTEEALKYPVREYLDAVWLDDCYDVNGAVVDRPALTYADGILTLEQAVYGSAQVRYVAERHVYTLTIPRREDALESFFSAAVYGLYRGGINWLAITGPPGVDEDDLDAKCGLDGDSTVKDDEDEPIPVTDEPYTRRTVIDYCSQAILSDEIS